jgi:hypothetical protein
VGIDAIERHTVWSIAHIRIKIFEAQPAMVADGNAVTAVIPITGISLIKAALFHCAPGTVSRSAALPVLRHAVSSKATAAI